MKKTHSGSCHCGAVRFTAPLDLDEGIRKCNCTYCFKTGYRKAFVYGDSVVVTGGQAHIGHYAADPSSWPEGTIDHMFCTKCGTQVFSRGYLEFEPFNGWFHAVNVSTLDDVTPEELDAAPIVYEDGLHDQQMQAPSVTGYL
ncbi:GFA family protein [Pelagibacterium flavum]|uniref:GFA family protein n=1 Tax=Pelagibacterium flavum TaxID=2984530 RepID=A0ABY6INM5_9HYPH|nr:GFA family protein [Pelagibacterium sp. YIM 151497]UYQ72190.1 GFA family protein [Pelagibacterium sp. YIM 151497]